MTATLTLMCGPVGEVNCELPVKKASAAGAVRDAMVEVNEIANKNSFCVAIIAVVSIKGFGAAAPGSQYAD